jgi:hypothetical protein
MIPDIHHYPFFCLSHFHHPQSKAPYLQVSLKAVSPHAQRSFMDHVNGVAGRMTHCPHWRLCKVVSSGGSVPFLAAVAAWDVGTLGSQSGLVHGHGKYPLVDVNKKLWKITMFNVKIHYKSPCSMGKSTIKWSCSIAILT